MSVLAEAWREMVRRGFLSHWLAFVVGMLTADVIAVLR